jgi:two-component system, OmpR family, sensor histidine kinase KdpD
MINKVNEKHLKGKPLLKLFHRFLNVTIKITISIGIVTLFSLILNVLRIYLSTSSAALLYLIPVLFSAALFGRLSGISASVFSFLMFNYLFIPPVYTFHVAQPQDLLAVVVFLGVATLISSLIVQIQSNLEEVKTRESEAVQLYELSVDLADIKDLFEVANVLANRLASLFADSFIEVEIVHSESNHQVRVPEEFPQNITSSPPLVIPFPTPNGQLSQIRIWKLENKITPEEERLLQTFAIQGALALDRVILSKNETRRQILEESDRLKTAILSSVSHELRTPLASIQATATSLFSPDLTLEQEARLELQSLLLEETDNMAQLVGNLLNMSRIEAGALKLQRQWNSPAEIVDTGLQRLHRISTDNPIEIDVPDDLPLISVDSVLIEQVIINLVRNSIKFAPAHTAIRINARLDNNALLTTVSNLGPHITAQNIEHVFEKFYPIPGKDTRQGTGLGLSICKGIVEAHGGKIWAENLAVGVAFHFSLPLTWDGIQPVIPMQENEDL